MTDKTIQNFSKTEGWISLKSEDKKWFNFIGGETASRYCKFSTKGRILALWEDKVVTISILLQIR